MRFLINDNRAQTDRLVNKIENLKKEIAYLKKGSDQED